jgi:hypothetical protein
MREFTDPFTGDPLENPTEKRYKVKYTIGNERREEIVSTLSEKALGEAEAKEKVGGPMDVMFPSGEINIESIRKIDEVDKGGSSVFGFE